MIEHREFAEALAKSVDGSVVESGVWARILVGPTVSAYEKVVTLILEEVE